MMKESEYRSRLRDYIRVNAQPPDKFSHQARLYRLACNLAEATAFDDDVLFAAAWLHDLGVFIGHRPADITALASWDHIAYALEKAPDILRDAGFPGSKIQPTLEAIRTHLPSSHPSNFEGILLRDADILEQLGAVAILRTVSKVGRDTRFVLFGDALELLRKNLEKLPECLALESARKLAAVRVATLRAFLNSAAHESMGLPW
jgi:uncharacterized protein